MAAYYVGFVIGSVAAPELVKRVGHIRVFAALTATAAATILVQGVFVGAWEWGLLRTVSGVCFAGIYVVAESWLNDRADQRSRGALLATYMVVIYVGLGAGQLLLNLADPLGYELFILIGVLISLAVVPMALTAQRAPEFALPHRVSFRELLAISPLGAIGALYSGATAGTLFSLGPVFAASSSLDRAGVATFMASSILPADRHLGGGRDRGGRGASTRRRFARVLLGGCRLRRLVADDVRPVSGARERSSAARTDGGGQRHRVACERRRLRARASCRFGGDAACGAGRVLQQHRRAARRVRRVRRMAQAQGRCGAGAREGAVRQRAPAGRADGPAGCARGEARGRGGACGVIDGRSCLARAHGLTHITGQRGD
jgi:hypothetical protein